jgi:hypothetical protein
MWWYTPAILALGRLRQDFECETSLGYIARSWLKKKKKKREGLMCIKIMCKYYAILCKVVVSVCGFRHLRGWWHEGWLGDPETNPCEYWEVTIKLLIFKIALSRTFLSNLSFKKNLKVWIGEEYYGCRVLVIFPCFGFWDRVFLCSPG